MRHYKFIRNFWDILNKNELMALGGQVSYYLVLSFFPLLIFLLTLISYLNLSSEQFFEDWKYFVPEESYYLVESIIYEIFSQRSPTLLSLSMLGTIWASLNGINALMRGIVKAYGLKEKRSYIRLKLTAILFLVIITITILLSIPLFFLGENISNQLFYLLGVTDNNFSYYWQKIRLVLQFLLLIIVFIILNRMATGSIYNIKMLLPGSLFSSSGWFLISVAFSYYIDNFSRFSLTYGSLTGIIILLIWLYWSIEILLLGCALNAVLIKTKGSGNITPNRQTD